MSDKGYNCSVTRSSYGPFLLLATTLHAFPVGWVLLHEPQSSVDISHPEQSFSVTFSEPQTSLPSSSSSQSSIQEPVNKERREIKYQNQSKGHKLTPNNDHSQQLLIFPKVCESLTSSSFPKNEHITPPKHRVGEETTTIVASKGNPEPIYPLEAREKGIEGTVWLRLTISPIGNVLQVEAIPPFTSPILQDVAVQTVKNWHFDVKRGDHKTSFIRDIPIDFRLA